jgi:N-acetyl-1-D-myo-inositol-2-amino-2-deoxy-alpha-D-glucopyranoside deacetylase/mycothiol S-conjugate amidase
MPVHPSAPDRPTLLLVHAHPDDESIATGGLILLARRAGERVVLVTCTDGGEGEIHNLDPELVRPRLGEVRLEELRRASRILGVDQLHLLGYRDSGMAGAAANRHPRSFHRAPLAHVAARLAGLLREERPATVVTYAADGTYGHPDHVKAHRATMAALALEAEAGWGPRRCYLHAVPRSRVEAAVGRIRDQGSPHPSLARLGVPDQEISLTLDVGPVLEAKRAAVAAHLSQNPAELCAAMTGQVLEAMGRHEHYVEWRPQVPLPDRRSPALARF